MNARLPSGAECYKRTPTFTESSVPAGLLNDHSTKEGTWGLIVVEHGKLRYLVTDPRRTPAERVLTPESAPGLVEPTILHRVEPLGHVQFHVEFYRRPEARAGPVRYLDARPLPRSATSHRRADRGNIRFWRDSPPLTNSGREVTTKITRAFLKPASPIGDLL